MKRPMISGWSFKEKKIHMHFKTLRENFLKEIFVKYIEAKLIDVSGDRDPIRLN